MSTPPTNFFKDRLKHARLLRNLSQAELAELTGLQVTAISHFETGTRSPSFDNLRKVADALKVTADYLLGRSETPKLSSETAGRLFKNVEKLTDADLQLLEKMADQLAKRNTSGA